ncbi:MULTISPECIES: ABC transporter permease [Bifidobacterium]|uniref:Peptide ABC transporter permease n=1 Tax=Bifidobacterium myosotis TaxID=1630166 RepID=A0A261FMP5_9BIFI|nr:MULTISPECIES: ABC transporter permease [Bifidobacterium]OZG60450.1 peptide ABC transporter permease [Bifidobacterium myosotis]
MSENTIAAKATTATADTAKASVSSPNAGVPDKVMRKMTKRRFRVPSALRTPLAIIGLIVLALWVLVIIFAPLLEPHDPLDQLGTRLSAPSAEYWFGTDTLGRDIFSRVVAASRISIPSSIVLVIFSSVIGSLIGAMAGYFGGWADEVFMRITDLVFAFPSTILAMVISAALGPSIQNAIIAVVLVSWPTYARLVRSLVLGLRSSEFVIVGRLLGRSSFASLFKDILPNILPHIFVLMFVDLGDCLLTLSGLSFLGLGATPPMPEWGQMVSEGVTRMTSWWLAFFPGLAIFTVVIAENFVGDAVRDWFDRSYISGNQEGR